MANKTVAVHLPELSGNTTLTLRLRLAGTVINGTGGDDLTETGTTGYFACTVTEATAAGWYSVDIINDGTLEMAGGWVYLPGDTEGTYTVDEPQLMRGTDNAALAATALSTATWTSEKAGFIDAAISDVQTAVNAIGDLPLTKAPTIERVLGDEDAIRFSWPVDGATITGEVSKAGGTYASVAGAISQRADEGSVHWYQLAYNVADRQLGSQRYKFTDGAYTRYVNLLVNPASAEVDLDPVLDKLPESGRAATQTSVDTIDGIVDTILEDTADLQANQGNWLTATGFSTHSATDVVTALGTGSTLTDCHTATGFAVPGDAMALTPAERSTFAGVLDLAIINQVDGADLIGALADAIAADWVAGDASPLAIIAALKADATYTTLTADASAGKTAAELVRDRLTATRAAKLDRDLAHAGDANTYKADVSAIETKAQADTRQTALTTAISGLDTKIGTPSDTIAADIAAIDAGGGGSLNGANTCVITVQDAVTSEAIVGAKVRVTLGTDTDIQATDAQGQVTFNLDNGSWTVSITKDTHSFAGTTLVVNGDEDETYQMTKRAISPPSDASLCRVYTYFKLNNRPIPGATLSAVVLGNNVTDPEVLSYASARAITNKDGYAEIDLVRSSEFSPAGGKYKITIVDSNSVQHFCKTVTIPDETTASLGSLS